VSRLHKGLILILGLALIFSSAVCLKARRELQAARRELLAVTTANEFLKKTLGDMRVAIGAKDREIDRLEHVGCDGQEKARPGVPMGPDRSKGTESDAVRNPWPAAGRHVAWNRLGLSAAVRNRDCWRSHLRPAHEGFSAPHSVCVDGW
jgi:hypothetical protein